MPFLDAAPPRTLTDAFLRRRGAGRSRLRDASLITLFSGFVALTAQVSVPLPFTPVPLTGQTFGVLFTGAALGSRRGALALLLYLLEGAAGLPVFAGGSAGAAHVFGFTGGYLLSYPLAAGMVGWLAERGWDRRILWTALAMVIGNLVIYTGGVLWLAPFVGGLSNALSRGMLPFLPGDAVKIALAALALPGGWRLAGTASAASAAVRSDPR